MFYLTLELYTAQQLEVADVYLTIELRPGVSIQRHICVFDT